MVSDNNVADEVVHAADSFFASRTDIRPDGLEVAQTEAVATVRLAGGLGLLASDAPEELGGGGGEPLYAGLIAESAGRNLIHPLILHQLGCVAYLTTSLESEKLSKEFALGHKIGLFAWHQAPTTRASVPGAIAKPDYAVIHTQGRGAFVAPSGSLGVEMSTETWRSPLETRATLAIPPASDGYILDSPSAEHALAILEAFVALYSLGAARQLLNGAVEYALVRRQFGAPIGSFQAVKHALANADIAIRHARALAIGSLAVSRDGDPGVILDLRLAKVAADRASMTAAETCLQIYGGLGFSWESDVHIYLKMFTDLGQWPMASALHSAALWRSLASAMPTT